jgi:hypothetical protein
LHIIDTIEHQKSIDAISKFKILRRLIKIFPLNKLMLKNVGKKLIKAYDKPVESIFLFIFLEFYS